MSPFEKAVMEHAAAFLSGDKEAFGQVYALTHGVLAARAVAKGADPQDAEDVASEATLYVQRRGSNQWDGTSLMALLNRAVDWNVGKLARVNRAILASDLDLQSAQDDIGEEFEHPMDLEELEEMRLREGAVQHPFLTSITTITPEDEALQENLLEKLERLGIEACGQRAWDIYSAVTLAERSQSDVAEEFSLTQQRVAQICNDVAVGIRQGLTGA